MAKPAPTVSFDVEIRVTPKVIGILTVKAGDATTLRKLQGPNNATFTILREVKPDEI